MDSKILTGPEEEVKVPEGSIGRIIYEECKKHNQDAIALVDLKTNHTLTYGEIIKYSENLAKNLKNRFGIKQNDIMAISSENSSKYYLPVLAGFYLAAPTHLLNPDYTIYELTRLINLSKPKLIFCSMKSFKNMLFIKNEFDFIEKLIIFDPTDDYNDYRDQTIKFDDLIQESDEENFEIEENFDPDEQTAIVLNSSGTTGLPKGVMLTHTGYRINIVYANLASMFNFGDNESSVLVAPLFHLYGITTLTSALYLNVKIFILDQFQPDLFLRTIQDHKIKRLFLVPALINFLAKHPIVDQYNVRSIEEIFSTSSPSCEEMTKLVMNKFGLKCIRQLYGMTELSAVACMTPIDQNRNGSCGKLLTNRLLKIVDIETNEILRSNQMGEICIKGAMMKGYINDPTRTEEAIDGDGFLHSGDIGYYDDEGYIFIVDRLKDLIKYKSFQVAPVELEDLLLQHPAIKDAGVIGIKDERAGELPLAFIVTEPKHNISEQEIIDYVAKNVSIQKQLHGGVRFVDEIPRNSLGKVLRKDLRQLLLEIDSLK